jgi:hypothetical protein
MLRHQAIAVALFLSTGTAACEMAGAPAPEKPATATPAAAAPTTVDPTPTAPAEPEMNQRLMNVLSTDVRPMELRPMTRGGPAWGKERPRFKVVTPPSTPPDASVPAPSK